MRGALLAAALAVPAAAAPSPAPRRVLALYSPLTIASKDKDVVFTPLHLRLETPLNHLGLAVDYVDGTKPLPDTGTLAGYRGVVSWFTDAVSFDDPRPVCRWLKGAMDAGLKVVMLGNPGVYTRVKVGQPTLDGECAGMLRELGVQVTALKTVDPLGVRVAEADARFMGFERRVDPGETMPIPFARLLPGSTALLRLDLDDGGRPAVSEPVGLTRRGGVALHPFDLYVNNELDPPQLRWVVDPFAFLDAALGVRRLPRPDVTTLSGRRVFLAHVDGDGFFNRSELDRRKSAGEVFLHEVLERYPDTPFTASLITGYYDLASYADAPDLALSRAVLTRPNVEPASHGKAHFLSWSKGTVALQVPGYAPDAADEIVGSVHRLERLFMPSARAVRVFLWTGDARPRAGDVALADAAGLLAMNGGGGVDDARLPSCSYLWPISRQVGSRRQVYAPGSNEEDYTNVWTGPFYGYREAVETFERSGAPRRLKPVDVYAHYYSAEKYAGLKALRSVLDWARRQPLIPVFASRYIEAAAAFDRMRLAREGDGRWLLSGGAAVRTVRFDDEPRVPDLAASRGVVGWRREGAALYVSLDASRERLVVLAKRPAPRPYIEEADFEPEGFARAGGGLSFEKSGWWTSEMTLAGLVPGRRYRVAGAGLDAVLAAGPDGRLAARFPDAERGGPARAVSVEPAP